MYMATVLDPIETHAMTPVPMRVARVRRELSDTFTLELEPPDGSFPFLPGQFTMLYVFGVGEVPISISGDPSEPGVLVQTIRKVGSVTRALDGIRAGDYVGVRGPFGTPWPVEKAEGGDLMIVGGGIGLAPLRPAIYHALTNRNKYHNVVLLYGTRSPRDLLFGAQLQHWSARLDIETLITVDTADRSWQGSVGVVTRLIRRAAFDPENTMAFVCGPEIMMKVTAETLTRTSGVAADQIYLTMERNMKCGIGACGHCQFGPHFVCYEGPVFRYADIERLLTLKEV
jgi:NAD(P)H-flavin reductase